MPIRIYLIYYRWTKNNYSRARSVPKVSNVQTFSNPKKNWNDQWTKRKLGQKLIMKRKSFIVPNGSKLNT